MLCPVVVLHFLGDALLVRQKRQLCARCDRNGSFVPVVFRIYLFILGASYCIHFQQKRIHGLRIVDSRHIQYLLRCASTLHTHTHNMSIFQSSCRRLCLAQGSTALRSIPPHTTSRGYYGTAHKVAKEEIPELDTVLRQFMKQVHPDRFIKYPQHRKHNEGAVQVMSSGFLQKHIVHFQLDFPSV